MAVRFSLSGTHSSVDCEVDDETEGLMLKTMTEPSTALRGLNEKVDALVNAVNAVWSQS